MSTVKSSFQQYQAQLAWKEELNSRFSLFHFELTEPNRLKFQAGQYVLLDIPKQPHKRSYSIASPPSMNHAIELLVDISPQGLGTQYLANLQPGEQVVFNAPLGNFTVPPVSTEIGQQEEELLFIATGSGVAPFKSILQDLLIDQQDQRSMILLWGMRSQLDQFWYDDFGILAQEHDNFSFQPVLSQPSSEWPFHKGYVTDVLSVQAEFTNRGYYLCGSNNMITDVRQLLLEKEVNPQHIHTESFF